MLYQGNVVLTSQVDQERKKDPLFSSYISDFKDFWLHGYNARVGKDIATARPNPPVGHRHTHLKPLIFPITTSNSCKTSTKSYWRKWLLNKSIAPPTSDRCLFYMVSTSRVAYIFHYQSEHSHKFMQGIKFKEVVYKMESLAEQHNLELMDFTEQQFLFSDKWLVQR